MLSCCGFDSLQFLIQFSVLQNPQHLLQIENFLITSKMQGNFQNVDFIANVSYGLIHFTVLLADPSTQAWVTLATNDSYALGALVLASSLKRSNTKRKIVIMVTPEGLSQPMKCQLKSVFDEVVDVSLLDSKDKVNLALLERPELGVTFTKLHCWCLVQYTKCVFLDADTMVSNN